MNIFKELKKAPKVEINETSYGYVKHRCNSFCNAQPNSNSKVFEGKTYKEWAEELEVTANTIQKRIRYHGTPYWKGNKNHKGKGYKHNPVLYEGLTVKQWCEKLGATQNRIRKRLAIHGHPYKKSTCREMGLELL